MDFNKQFVMSQYASKEDLYKAKAEHFEKLFNYVASQLEFAIDMIPNLDDVLEQFEYVEEE